MNLLLKNPILSSGQACKKEHIIRKCMYLFLVEVALIYFLLNLKLVVSLDYQYWLVTAEN